MAVVLCGSGYVLVGVKCADGLEVVVVVVVVMLSVQDLGSASKSQVRVSHRG